MGRKEISVSLRLFHLLFILAVLVLTDMFGAWAFWRYGQSSEAGLLVAGIMSFLAGFGVAAYAVFFVRKVRESSAGLV
jgi:hypothetical protein